MPIRVDFHCRLIFKCVYKHVNFNLVNKIEARYKVLNFFFTVERGSNFTFSCGLSNIASILFANINFTHVRDNGNPPSISFNKESLLKRCCYSSTPPIACTYSIRIDFLYSYLRLVSLPKSLFSPQLNLFTTRPKMLHYHCRL